MAYYLETSTFLKLVVDEAESEAMRLWFHEGNDCWSSHLLSTEAFRAAARLRVSSDAARRVLDAVSLVLPAESTFREAGPIAPTALRSLDALHVASALEMGTDLEAIVTHDPRVIECANAAGSRFLTPV